MIFFGIFKANGKPVRNFLKCLIINWCLLVLFCRFVFKIPVNEIALENFYISAALSFIINGVIICPQKINYYIFKILKINIPTCLVSGFLWLIFLVISQLFKNDKVSGSIFVFVIIPSVIIFLLSASIFIFTLISWSILGWANHIYSIANKDNNVS